MKITFANVKDWAEQRGLEPVQIDGIPEGFSFKEPTVTISNKEHIGGYVAYIPFSDWDAVYANSEADLQTKYQQHGK